MENELTRGPVMKTMLRFAIPMILGDLLQQCYNIADTLIVGRFLGAGALAGTTYPLDREYTAELLEFDGPTLNSMDSVSDRDYLIELLSAMSTVMMHLSRFSEEVII